ncbi:hypothetical protein [Burkholderia sp. IMCC1007]|uniref:hypothetical protein n=1 Tax=Burkholderia sp. IMCC1007 TaxID=3004104 RepID=UPI0022B4F7F4|nr:hypothetical protein [Burkholderia sp. IMCC1007]
MTDLMWRRTGRSNIPMYGRITIRMRMHPRRRGRDVRATLQTASRIHRVARLHFDCGRARQRRSRIDGNRMPERNEDCRMRDEYRQRNGLQRFARTCRVRRRDRRRMRPGRRNAVRQRDQTAAV